MVVVAEVRMGRRFWNLSARELVLVLLDLAMPGKDGLDTLKELKQEKPQLPVLVLSISRRTICGAAY